MKTNKNAASLIALIKRRQKVSQAVAGTVKAMDEVLSRITRRLKSDRHENAAGQALLGKNRQALESLTAKLKQADAEISAINAEARRFFAKIF